MALERGNFKHLKVSPYALLFHVGVLKGIFAFDWSSFLFFFAWCSFFIVEPYYSYC